MPAPSAAYVKKSVQQLRQDFQPWVQQAREVQKMMQPRPGQTGGAILASAALSKRVASDAESAMAHMSEYISGRMAVGKENFVGRALRRPPRIEPAKQETDAGEQAKQHALFQVLHGIHNVLNEDVQSAVLGTSWDRSVLEHLVTFGKVATFPHAEETPGGGVRFKARLADPLSVYHDFDSSPWRCVWEYALGSEEAAAYLDGYEVRGDAARKLQDAQREERMVKVGDFFYEEPVTDVVKVRECRVYRAILIDDEVAAVWETGFTHRPVVIQAVHASPGSYVDFSSGGMARTGQGTRGVAADRILHHAESVLAPLFYINQQFQQYMSLLMEALARTMNPGEEIIVREGGEADIPGPEATGPGSRYVHGPDVERKVQDFPTAQVSQAAQLFQQIIDREFDRLFPTVLFGESNPGDSGYLQVIKVSHAVAVFQETVNGAGAFGKRVFDELVHQFVSQKLTFKVEKFQLKGKGAPQFFEGGDFDSGDLPKQYIINFEWLPDYAENEPAKVEVASRVIKDHLMSWREAVTNILGNEDPDKTKELIEQEQYEANPGYLASDWLYRDRVRIQQIKAAAEDQENKDLKFALLKQAKYLEMEYAAKSAQAFGQAAGASQPTASGGFSPSTMPPEMGIGNPDRAAQAQGRVSSATGGRPRPQAQGAA